MSKILEKARDLLRKADEVGEKKEEEPSYLLGEEEKREHEGGVQESELPPHSEEREPGGPGHKEPDEDNYSAEKMKRYFARFLAEEPEYAKEELKRAGMLSKAAAASIPATRGLGKDKLNADAVMVDGTSWMRSVIDSQNALVKAMDRMIANQGRIHARLDRIEPLAKASAISSVETLSLSKAIAAEPVPVKGAQHGSAAVADKNGLRHPIPLLKAELRKRTMANDKDASRVLSALATAYDRPELLPGEYQNALKLIDDSMK